MGANTSQTDRNKQETKSSWLEIVFFLKRTSVEVQIFEI